MGVKGVVVSLLSFVHSLWQGGKIHISPPMPEPTSSSGAVAEILREMDGYRRLELPGHPPELNLPSAEWAAAMLHAASQFLVYREVSGDIVADRLAQPCPTSPSPATCYSVDLTFAALPDLISLARGIAANDPLTVGLMSLAAQWPLSSVGVADVASVEVDAFVNDDCLARLYVDRVIQRRDLKRLDHPRVRRLTSEAIGPYTELAPLVAAEIEGEAP